jgi:hypothetical protein
MVLEFIFRLIVVKKLQQWFPKLGNPLPMELVMESELPYTQVPRQTQGWIDRVRRPCSLIQPNSLNFLEGNGAQQRSLSQLQQGL